AGDEVSCVVGFSGGADSTALLYLLVRLRAFFSRFEVVAYHLHHGLRETADGDEAFCVSVCRELNIPLVVEHEDVKALAKKRGWSIEEAGRERRREGYERIRKQYDLTWICLAHHQDDQVESFFLRLFHGGGIEALSGMRAKEGVYLRPCLEFSHSDMMAYLKRHGIGWREDESNEEMRFDRNWIRHEFLPVVERRFPAVRHKIVRTMGFLSSVSEMIQERLSLLEKRVEFFSGGWRLPREWISQEGEFLVREMVRFLWRREGIWQVRGSWLDAIQRYEDSECRELINHEYGGMFLDRSWLTWVRWRDFKLPLRQEIKQGETIVSGPWQITREEGKLLPPEFPRASKERMFFPLEVKRVEVRPVQPGERVSLGFGHKKVHDIWVDEHIPWLERRWSFV
ncbi:MAG: tRNA lysidine(34) synthetase TilS, partial [Brevinematales bacterium]